MNYRYRYYEEKPRYDEKPRYSEEKPRYSEEKPRYSEEKTRYPEEKPRYNEETRYEDKTKYFNRYNEVDRRDPPRQPKPAPRNIEYHNEYDQQVPLERYRNQQYENEMKRRSMYNLIEDEHRRTSNEIAKELKRRTYVEPESYDSRYYPEDSNRLTKSTLDLDKIGNHRKPQQMIPAPRAVMTKSTLELNEEYSGQPNPGSKIINGMKVPPQQVMQNVGGYRHSYAEPKLRMERMGGKKLFPDMLHRANSSVSNSGRVGIASIHPY